MTSGLRQYVKNSGEKALSENKEYHLFGRIYVYIKDPLPQGVDVVSVLHKVEQTVPHIFAQSIESVFIGQFEELTSREVAAVYDSGTIYLSNDQDNELDMYGDIVHEIAHSIEEWAGFDIYSDGSLEREFLKKRKKLLDILLGIGYNVSLEDFMEVEYSKKFDFFLYKSVGYDKLSILSVGLFPTPYSVTSIREYFAVGFEEFISGNRYELEGISPVLYGKLEQLVENLEEW